MDVLFVLFNALLLLGATNAAGNIYLQRELTVRIEPGKIDCFFVKAFDKQVIDIEYQVIDGGHGDLDISFELLNPTGYPHISEYKKPDNVHRVNTNMEGDYKFCFDNSFSTFNSKLVFFEIIVEWEDDNKQQSEDDWGQDVLNNLSSDQLITEKVKCAIHIGFCLIGNSICLSDFSAFFCVFSSTIYIVLSCIYTST